MVRTLLATVRAILTLKYEPEMDQRTLSYGCDSLLRLTEAVESPGTTYTYTYDLVGNRTEAWQDGVQAGAWTYNAADQVDGVGWSYDKAGNLLSDGVRDVSYDGLNRVLTVTQGLEATGYRYNGDGTLVASTSDEVTTRYVQDLASPLSQILVEEQGSTSTRYLYGLGRFAAVQGSTRTWEVHDALGSVRQVLGDTGGRVASLRYDPWGTPVSGSPAPFGFTGELQDGNTGLVHLRARWYQPETGRFLSRDPFEGFPTIPYSQHPYQYGYSNPVNYTDPTGHYIETVFDIGFIAYDIYKIVNDNILNGCDNLGENLTALGLDVAGAALPFATGLGAASRAARHADDIVDVARRGDDLVDAARNAERADDISDARKADDVSDARKADDSKTPVPCRRNSFSADTDVWTKDGVKDISDIEVGDLVWAYNEETGTTGLYTVTATIAHLDHTLVYVTIDGEEIETTPEHPFYVEGKGWVDASDLQVGDEVRQADGTTGAVETVEVEQRPQVMYNLTVAEAHTFFVGDGQWLVHNANPDGCLGGPSHRELVEDVEWQVRLRGLEPVKEYVVPIGGGPPRHRQVDVAGLDPITGEPIEFHQIGVAERSGEPVLREQSAIQEIQEMYPGIEVEFHAYKTK